MGDNNVLCHIWCPMFVSRLKAMRHSRLAQRKTSLWHILIVFCVFLHTLMYTCINICNRDSNNAASSLAIYPYELSHWAECKKWKSANMNVNRMRQQFANISRRTCRRGLTKSTQILSIEYKDLIYIFGIENGKLKHFHLYSSDGTKFNSNTMRMNEWMWRGWGRGRESWGMKKMYINEWMRAYAEALFT